MESLESQQILLIMAVTCLICLGLERRLAWISHISGICLIILSALLLSAIGVIPNQHHLYDFFMGPTVPMAIALMVFGIRFRHLIRLPRSLILIFGFGILASVLGGLVAALLGAKSLGENAPKLAAQLTASYIGGNENAVAVKKMLDIPNELFVASFAVDNVVTSLWMVATLLFARSKLTETNIGEEDHRTFDRCSTTLVGVLASIALGLIAIQFSHLASQYIGFLHPMLYLTLVAFLISRFKWIQDLVRPAYLIGTVLFVPFFFSIGAISDIRALSQLPSSVLFMPFVIVGVHGVLIYSVGRLLKVPSCETSIASQSLIGGAGTAVALAQAKSWQSGISMGLVLGLVGYAVANFFGILAYHLSKILISYFGVI